MQLSETKLYTTKQNKATEKDKGGKNETSSNI